MNAFGQAEAKMNCALCTCPLEANVGPSKSEPSQLISKGKVQPLNRKAASLPEKVLESYALQIWIMRVQIPNNLNNKII